MITEKSGRTRFKKRLEDFLGGQKTIGKFITLAVIKSLDENRENIPEITGSELKKKTESNLSILRKRSEKISSSTFYDVINKMADDEHQLLQKREVRVGKKKRKIITKYRLNLDLDLFGPIFIEDEEEAEKILQNIDDDAYFDFGDKIFSKEDLLKDKSIAFLNLPDQVRACAFDIKSKEVIGEINNMSKANSFGMINIFHGEGYIDRPFSAQRLLAYRLIVEGMKTLSEIQNNINFQNTYYSGSKSFIVTMKCDPDTDFHQTLREFDYFSHNNNFELLAEPMISSINEMKKSFTPDFNFAWVQLIVNGVICHNSKEYLEYLRNVPCFDSEEGKKILKNHLDDMKGLTHEFARCIVEICYENIFYQRVFESVRENIDWKKYLDEGLEMDLKGKSNRDSQSGELYDKDFWKKIIEILNQIIPLVQSNKIEDISIFPEPKETNILKNYLSITYNAGTSSKLKMCFLMLDS